MTLAPYVGLYGDYYYENDDAAAVPLAGAAALVSVPLLEGWSMRATGGVAAHFANGTNVAVGAEFGGIGSSNANLDLPRQGICAVLTSAQGARPPRTH